MCNYHVKTKGTFFLWSAMIFMSSCATISKYDQYSYTQATSTKIDALNVMSDAADSFPLHTADVKGLRTQLSKIYEYEKNKPKNIVTTKMWSVLIDSTGSSLGGFLSRWQKEKKLDAAFINDSKQLIGESFDQISGLESGKIKPTN